MKKRDRLLLDLVLFVISFEVAIAVSGVTICGTNYNCGANDGICPEDYGANCCGSWPDSNCGQECCTAGDCGADYWECSGNTEQYVMYSCNSNICSSGVYQQFNCDLYDGWSDSSTWACSPGNCQMQKNQEYRDYYCSAVNGRCAYNPTNTQTIYELCSLNTACVNGVCASSNVCNSVYKCSTTVYGDGGQYSCQATCDGSSNCNQKKNNCDYCGLDTCFDSGDEPIIQNYIDDYETCQNGVCQTDNLNVQDVCSLISPYNAMDRKCDASLIDETTPLIQVCDDYDDDYPAPCDISGTALREWYQNWNCGTGKCQYSGSNFIRNQWTCDVPKECTEQLCGGVSYKCYYDNSYKWAASYPSETSCTDVHDNDCDTHIDSRDSSCLIASDITMPNKIVKSQTFEVRCQSTSVSNCVGVDIRLKGTTGMYQDYQTCTNTGWSNYDAVFSCRIDTLGTYTITCHLPNKAICTSWGSPDESGTPPDSSIGGDTIVIPDQCSERTQTDCAFDGLCKWCPDDCTTTPGKWSGYLGGVCIDVASNCQAYYCEADYNNEPKCGAECDGGSVTCPDTICDDYCSDAYNLYLRSNLQNSCDLTTTCTCSNYGCQAPTSSPCGVTLCDAAKHLTGSCQNPCNEAGLPNDGTDATCGVCIPTFPGDCRCVPGWNNIDGNPANGCEYQCTVSNGGIEICDNLDNDCDGLLDEGCDDDNDDYCDTTIEYIASSTCPKGPGDCNDNNININPGI
ncbi:MAG: hypothetical protein V1859_03045, partial [archaeon]